MFRVVTILLLMCSFLNASYMMQKKWNKGETVLDFLALNNLSSSIYYGLSTEDKEIVSEVISGSNYQVLYSDKNIIEQVLIPVTEELQMHIYKERGEYYVEMDPIVYTDRNMSVAVYVQHSIYKDVVAQTNNIDLANSIISAFDDTINFQTNLRKGDLLVVLYEQKIRLGEFYGVPDIKSVMVEIQNKNNYIFEFKNNRYFDEDGVEIEGFFLSTPVKYTRISDVFTLKRYHPILKIYRAHLGIDYAAPIGTPVKAAGDGKITFVGNNGGYGKSIIINHQNGYKTLYAHLSKYAKSSKLNHYVHKGDTVGYVGSTGLSTGPHLHFGLYKNGRAINPQESIKIKGNVLKGQEKKEFEELVKTYIKNIDTAKRGVQKMPKVEKFNYSVKLEDNFYGEKKF